MSAYLGIEKSVFITFLVDHMAKSAGTSLTITDAVLEDAFGKDVLNPMFSEPRSDPKPDTDEWFDTYYEALLDLWAERTKVVGDDIPPPPAMTRQGIIDWWEAKLATAAGNKAEPVQPATANPAQGNAPATNADEASAEGVLRDPFLVPAPDPAMIAANIAARRKRRRKIARWVAGVILGTVCFFAGVTVSKKLGLTNKLAELFKSDETAAAAPPQSAPQPQATAETAPPEQPTPTPPPLPEKITLVCNNDEGLPRGCRAKEPIEPNPRLVGCAPAYSWKAQDPLVLACPGGEQYASTGAQEDILPQPTVEVALYLQE